MERAAQVIARIFLAAIFVVAGALKLRDPAAFADGMAGFRLIPHWAIPLLATGIPIFEIATGTGLLLGRFRSAAALSACGLSAAFVALYAWACVAGIDVRCSCFGEMFRVTKEAGLARAAAMLALSCWIYFRSPRDQAPSRLMP